MYLELNRITLIVCNPEGGASDVRMYDEVLIVQSNLVHTTTYMYRKY